MAASGQVTPKDIYLALTHAGASTVQAIGIMANMMAESTLNPEAVNPAGPQSGVGLVQWQTTDYPGAANLVTGNPMADMQAQVRFLAMTGGFKAADGTNAGQAAANFASNYEKCATCQPGGAQYNQRVQNTLTIAGWIRQGNWPHAVGGSREPGAIGTAPTSGGGTPDCAWQIGLNIPLVGGNVCLVTKSELRGIAGVAMMGVAGLFGLAGLAVLIAAAGMKAIPPLGKAAEAAGGALLLVPGAEGIGAGMMAAGKTARNPAAAGKARQSRRAGEENASRRRLGEPRENPAMEARGGTVRQDRRQQAAQRSRERRRATADEPPF